MKKKVIDLILLSQIFSSRQKWAIVKWLKNNEIPKEKLEKIFFIFNEEKNFFVNHENLTEEEYLKKLQQWNIKLKGFLNKKIFKEISDKEDADKKDENPEDFLEKELGII